MRMASLLSRRLDILIKYRFGSFQGLTRRVQSSRGFVRADFVASAEAGDLEPPDVRKLAKLAQIRVSDEEVADWEPQIRKTIEWFDQLQKIDVEGVEPCTRASLADLLASREDIPEEFPNREALMESVPDREGPYVKVPKIL